MCSFIYIFIISGVATKYFSGNSQQQTKVLTGSNTWYKVHVSHNGDDPAPGPFSFLTNTGHPWGGDQQITFYVTDFGWPWWSYFTVRNYTDAIEIVIGDDYGDSPLSNVNGSSGFTKWYAYDYFSSIDEVTFNGGAGIRQTMTGATVNITQEIECEGTTFDNSRIRFTVIVSNPTSSQKCYGIREFLDINVAGNDGAYLYTPHDAYWRSDEEAWDSPIPFKYYVISYQPDFSTNKYIYGNIADSSHGMVPTPPEHFSYAYWGDYLSPYGNGLFGAAWYDCASQNRSVGGVDASVAYWWGYNSPICLNPGESFNATQYVYATTQPPPGVLEENRYTYVKLKNTIGNKIELSINLFNDTNVKIGIYNTTGSLISSFEYSLSSGKHNISHSLGKLPPGIYFVIVSAGSPYKFKFVKL